MFCFFSFVFLHFLRVTGYDDQLSVHTPCDIDLGSATGVLDGGSGLAGFDGIRTLDLYTFLIGFFLLLGS